MSKSATLILIMSSIISLSSMNITLMWIMIELNSMSFITLMKKDKNTENMMKYFLIQSMGSIPLIMAMMNQSMMIKSNMITSSSSLSNLTMLSMLIKMGMAPFHYWLIQTAIHMSRIPLFLLMTIQKLIPILISCSTFKSNLLSISIMTSSLMGSMSMVMSSKINMIIILSSINHMSWMLMASSMSNKLTIMYLLVYSIILNQITKKTEKMKKINWMENKPNKTPMSIEMLSLGGMPPLLGFTPKASIIYHSLQNQKTLLMMMILLISSMISMISYLRVTLKNLMKKSKSSKNKKEEKNSMNSSIQFMLPTVLIILTPNI